MAKIRPVGATISPLPFPLMKRSFENYREGKVRPMLNLLKLKLTAGALALGAAAFAPSTFAVAADMPMAPPQMQGEVQPPPPAYYPPQVYSPQVYPPQVYPPQVYPPQVGPGYPPPVAYAAPPPPPVYYADVAPPYAAWPGPYYYGPGYGFGPRWAYGRWGHWHR
jgi:hypothetical protein